MTFHEIFPNISIFVGVFLLFVFLFSPSIFVCCGSRRKSVKPTIKIVKSKNSDIVKIAQRRSATELLKFNSNMLKEGKVCIISLNDLNEKHCLALQHRYEHDPLLFSRYKMVLENGNNHDNDNDDNSKDISSQNMNSHDMMALFENGKKWTLFKYPDKDFDNSGSNLTDTRNTDFIDVWLSRLLGGEIIWTKTVDKDIPYVIELTDMKL